jgi:hypothetical protein
MAGRPKRKKDPVLAQSLRKWQAESELNYSQVARMLRVAVSTLIRSLQNDSFSKALGERVHKLLSGPEEVIDAASGDVGSWVRGISENDLRLLRKFVNLIPKAEKILSVALDQPSGRKKS